MKTDKTMIAAVAALLAVSVATGRGQVLTFSSGATLKGELTDQTLVNSGTEANDGTISTWVVSDSTVDSAGYVFIYQLDNNGPDDLTGLSLNNFSGSVDTALNSGTYSSISGISLANSQTPSASAGAFIYQGVTGGGAASFAGSVSSLQPGGVQSLFFVVYSDVNMFSTGYALSMDNFQVYGNIYAPIAAVNPVPEPSSAILLIGGIVCLCGILRVRRAMS